MSASRAPQTVVKTLRLLDYFTAERPQCGLSDLSRAANMPKATVARCLAALEQAGFLVQDPETKNYRLGYKLLELGNLVRDQIELRKVALPFMIALRDKSGESVHLTAVVDGEGTYLEKVDSLQPVRLWTRLSGRGPLYAGASRKILMAYLPEEEINAVIKKGLVKFTERTITDPDALKQHLRTIREQGWATSAGELFPESASVAAPIRDDTGKVVAGLSVAGPASRFTDERVAELIPMVVETANAISRALGYNHGTAQAPAS